MTNKKIENKLIINDKEYNYKLEWYHTKLMSEILDTIDYKLALENDPKLNALGVDFINYVLKKYHIAYDLIKSFLCDIYKIEEKEFNSIGFSGPLKLLKFLFKDKELIDFFSSLLK